MLSLWEKVLFCTMFGACLIVSAITIVGLCMERSKGGKDNDLL